MSRRETILHSVYVRMSRRGRSMLMRVRPLGWVAVSVAMVLLFLGADPTRSTAYQLFSLMFAMLGMASFSGGFFRVAGVARRTVPSTCVPGIPVEVEIEVRNTGRRNWHGVRLLEVPMAPVPTLEEFLSNPEPGERLRNVFDRNFIFYRFAWLGERRMTFRPAESEAFDLAAGGTARIRVRVLPLRRGMLDLRDLRLVRDDAFGFFRRVRSLDSAPVRLAVVPRPAAAAGLPARGAAGRPLPSGQSPWHRSGQSDEFLALREYRPGDPLQHIHWAAFARAGQPIVREFEDMYQPRTALILDCLLPSTGKAFELTLAFEAAVQVAASLAGLIQRGETLLELLLVQDRAHNFTSGPGHLQVRRLLEVLAALQPCVGGSIERLERLALAHATGCGNAHFIGLVWDEDRRRMLSRLRARGVSVTATIVTPETKGSAARPADVPGWVALLPASRVACPPDLGANPSTEESAA